MRVSNSLEYETEKTKKKFKIIRNEFKLVGRYDIPLIKKQDIDLDSIELLSINKINNNKKNEYKTIHFFTHDWHFENAYFNSKKTFEELKKYYAVLSPDFSLYSEMPLALQINSTFKNRWCGAYWQTLGLRVIPTIEWGNEETFDFCFDGVEHGSVVAVSTYYRQDYREDWIKGYNKMLEIINPSAIICYGEPFPNMKGNIKYIDPYNTNELIRKLGKEEYLKRYFEGSLYPEI